MASRYQNFIKGIGLVPNSGDANSKKGDLNATADGKLNYHNGTSSSPVVTEAHASQGSNRLLSKDLDDTTTSIVDGADTTIKIKFDAAGSTGTTTTLLSSQTANRVLTLPDATDTLIGRDTSDTLTNKTLSTGCTIPLSGVTGLAANVATFLATPSSANLASAVTDETGTGALVFANTPTLVTPILGTPQSGTLSNCTDLPISTGVSGLGSGVATFLATPSSANLAAAVTDETGTGALVFANTPTLVTPILGAATATSITGPAGAALLLQSATNQNVNIQAQGTSKVQVENITFDGNYISTTAGFGMIVAPSTGNLELISGNPLTTGGNIFLRTRTAFETEAVATTGTAITISSGYSHISFVGAGLVSIAGIIGNKSGEILYINNSTGSPVTILNDSPSASAIDRILTGTGDDIILEDGASIAFINVGYSVSRWMVVGGTGAGAIIKAVAGESITAGQAVYISVGAADGGRTAGRAYKLDAANDNRVDFVGIAKSSVSSGANLQIIPAGEVATSGLTTGRTIFADPTSPGNFTTTAPSAVNQWIIPVGIALSATKMAVNGAGSATAVKITSEVVDGLYADVQSYSVNTTLTNANSVVLVNASGGSRTITLPAPARGKIFNIKKTDSSLNTVVISPPSGTIDGAASRTLSFQYDSVMITSDGTNFFLI